MAVQYGHDADFLGVYSIMRARAQNLAADPSGLGVANAGQFWFNTTDKALKLWTGTAVLNLSDIAATTGNLPVSRVSGAAATGTTRLSDFATPPNAPVPFGGQKITGLADGTTTTDGVTVGQLEAVRTLAASAAQGIAIKAPVMAVDTTGITQTGAQTVDGVALPTDGTGRYLRAVGNQAGNGIWVARSGAHTRAEDADATGEMAPGTQVTVTGGALAVQSGGNADSVWRIVSDTAITPGTTAHTWEKLPTVTGEVGVGGAGLTKTGSTYDVGAGDGILVDADAVRVAPKRVTRKRSGTVPTATGSVTCDDGSTMSVSVTGSTVAFTHNLGSPCAEARFFYGSSPGSGNTQGQELKPDNTNSADGNSTTSVLPAAPGNNQLLFQLEG